MLAKKTKRTLFDKQLSFRGASNQPLKAEVKKISKQEVIFELVDPGGQIVEGEQLKNVEVIVNGKCLFEGDIHVTKISKEGLNSRCVANFSKKLSFDEIKEEGAFLSGLEEQLENHLQSWGKEHEVRSSFHEVVGDLEVYLEGLQNWCDQLEVGVLGDVSAHEQEVLAKLAPVVSREIESHFKAYEREVAALDEEQRLVHRAYLMKAVHRFILQSPFSYRCFTKPLGYAGDYGMVQLMLGNPFQGESIFGKLLNFAFLRTGPVAAHQNRIDYLVATLRDVVGKRAAKGLKTRILNLGCGPAEEVQRFIESEAMSESCEFQLLDFNEETLAFTERQLGETAANAGRKVSVEFIKESIQGFVREVKNGGYEQGEYDLVYCAGLFDYLDQRFCQKLTGLMSSLIKEGGLAVVTNVSRENSIPAVMADFLEWVLIERTEEEMYDLVPTDNLSLLNELKSDSTRINLFLELRLPVANRNDVANGEKKLEVESNGRGVSREVRGGGSRLQGSKLSRS